MNLNFCESFSFSISMLNYFKTKQFSLVLIAKSRVTTSKVLTREFTVVVLGC